PQPVFPYTTLFRSQCAGRRPAVELSVGERPRRIRDGGRIGRAPGVVAQEVPQAETACHGLFRAGDAPVSRASRHFATRPTSAGTRPCGRKIITTTSSRP